MTFIKLTKQSIFMKRYNLHCYPILLFYFYDHLLYSSEKTCIPKFLYYYYY